MFLKMAKFLFFSGLILHYIYCGGAGLVAKSCLTLVNLMNCSPPGSPVHGISQARMLERVAVPLTRESP